VKGLALRVGQKKSWTFFFTRDGKRVRLTFGAYPTISLAAARRRALEARGEIAEGRDPRSVSAETLQAICEEYLGREGSKLRSKDWQARALERLVYPTLGARPIGEIRRTEIIRLLDRIEDENGAVMADRTLAVVRKIMNWHASRSDDFRSPIVRGMARSKSLARERTLTDNELRKVWAACEGVFGAMVKFILLTAARRSEATKMAWAEIDGADWTLPAARNKTKVDLVRPLSKAALAALPKRTGDFVFSRADGTPLSRPENFKLALDKASGVSGYTIHDLRRTARTLLSRAGVSADVAERCLGHVIGGVRGVYDRHEYHEEKATAFEALAAQIDRIVNPQDNVVAIGGKRNG
jgi:integrase